MDLRLRPLIHRYLQRTPFLFCHILPIQWSSKTLRTIERFLEVFPLLLQPQYLLDRWRYWFYTRWYTNPMFTNRINVLQSSTISIMFFLHCALYICRRRISHES